MSSAKHFSFVKREQRLIIELKKANEKSVITRLLDPVFLTA